MTRDPQPVAVIARLRRATRLLLPHAKIARPPPPRGRDPPLSLGLARPRMPLQDVEALEPAVALGAGVGLGRVVRAPVPLHVLPPLVALGTHGAGVELLVVGHFPGQKGGIGGVDWARISATRDGEATEVMAEPQVGTENC